jgi:HPt (histidine-containing phosphotransfer) domain-containing protein
MRAAHVIKGAASNLMCAQLRQCAMQLETSASSAANESDGATNEEAFKDVQAKFDDLKAAVQKYHEYLTEVGV